MDLEHGERGLFAPLHRQWLPAIEVGVDLPFRKPLVAQTGQRPEESPCDQAINRGERDTEDQSRLRDEVGQRFKGRWCRLGDLGPSWSSADGF